MTIGDARAMVTDELLKRDDVNTLVEKLVVRAYRTITHRVPFEELQITGADIPTVVDQVSYDMPTDLAGIVSIKITYGTNSSIRLRKDNVRTYDQAPVTRGRSVTYGRWAKKVELFPKPDAVYQLTPRYWKAAPIDAVAANTVLLIPDAWVELLEWEAYYRTLIALHQPGEAAALMQTSIQPKMPSPHKTIVNDLGIIPRLWNDLLTTINQRELIDDDYMLQLRRF